MINRAARIDQIFHRRAELRVEVGVLIATMTELADAVAQLDGARRGLQTNVDPEAYDALQQIGTTAETLNRRIAAVQRDIARTEARLGRTALTIGAVGRSGQGKSRFLQSLTGLSDQEIPAARGGFMTGAPSVIRHDNRPTTAEVEFYDAASFLADIIGPYYRKLGLGPEPASLGEFARATFPELPVESTNRDKEAYDHLQVFRDELGSYGHHLTATKRVQQIAPDEILKYVAQHDGAGHATHDFRAVRRVRITATFLAEDLDRLVVIDLPGMGDTNLHDEYLLRQALEDEVDLVLFILRPDPLRVAVHEYDVDLYELARNALPELPVERWSFLVVNKVAGGDGTNADVVDQFVTAVGRSRVQVSQIEAADVSDPAEVAKVFDAVVERAVGTLDELDRTLVERRRSDVAAVQAEALILVEEARIIGRRAVPSGAWFPRFQELFNEVHSTLSFGLEELVLQFGDGITERDDVLGAAIASALANARGSVVAPSVEDIRSRAAREGALGTALNSIVNESRAQISREFLALDAALKSHVDAMHEQIAGVLSQAGRLPLAPGDAGDARTRIQELETRFPEDRAIPQLRYGFRFLTEFTLNYRGMIQHRVRRVLGKLDPDEVPYEAGMGPADIRYTVEELVAETLFEIESALQTMALEPREAVFAVVEEFRDRVLRSPNAQDEWRTLYEALRAEVWAEEFEALAANTTLFNRWSQAVEAVSTAAKER